MKPPDVEPLAVGRLTLTDLETDADEIDADTSVEPQLPAPAPVTQDQRTQDRATIQRAEQRLIAQIENAKLPPEARKTALRELICAQRGIDYARLPASDPARAAIDREVETRFTELAARQADAAKRAALDKTIDNAKLSRETRLDAFYQQFLLDRGVRESTAETRAEFDQTQVPLFDLRDEVRADSAKQRAIIKNRKLAAQVRLAAYRQLFRNQYVAMLGVRFAALEPAQRQQIDARFDADVAPQFQRAEAEARERKADAARAKGLEAQLRPAKRPHVYGWGRYVEVVVPNKPEVMREILTLRLGVGPQDARVARKVSAYSSAVEAQNAASREARSAVEYFNVGFIAAPRVTKADIQRLWGGVQVGGMALADAMFPDAGMPLIAGSQRTPILIRAGALLYGGEKPDVVDRLVARGQVRIADLTRAIVLLTPEVMNHYLDKVLLPLARELLSADDQAALQEAVLSAYQQDLAAGTYETSTPSFDAELALAKKAIGPNPVSVDGAPIDLGDKNSQAATLSWTQSVRMKATIDEAQQAVDEQQREVDQLREAERKENERRHAEQAEKLRNNPYLLNKVGTGPDYVDPKRREAEQELAQRQAVLQRRKDLAASYTDQALKLKTGAVTYDQVAASIRDQIQQIDGELGKYRTQLADARVRSAAASKKVAQIRERSIGKDRGSGAELGDAIREDEASREVRELQQHIAQLESQRGELSELDKTGSMPSPIRMQEIKTTVEKGYRFVPLGERWSRAALAGLEEAGGLVVRVFAGIADVSIPGLIERGGNAVLAELGSQARLNLGIGTATSQLRSAANWLELNAQHQMKETGGGLDVEIIKGLTSTAVLYLPTMGFGSVGAAIGGAIRATQMARTLGTAVSLGTMGVLASLDKGPGEMARTAVPMAAMPMLGGVFKSIGARLVSEFFTNMASDVLTSANYGAALDVLSRGGTPTAAIKAAGSTVDWTRALASGIVGVAMEARSVVDTQKPAAVADEGMPIVARESPDGKAPTEYLRYTADGVWTPIPAQLAIATATKQGRPPVKLTTGELALVQKGGDGAMQTLLLAEQRGHQLEGWGREVEARQLELTTTTDKPRVQAELARAQANERILRAADQRAPITSADVELAGQAPLGYVRDRAGTTWHFDPDAQQRQIAVKTAETTAIENAKAGYEHDLAELYRVRDQLSAATRKKPVDATKLAALEARSSELAAKVQTGQQTYLRIATDPSLIAEVQRARAALAEALTVDTTSSDTRSNTTKSTDIKSNDIKSNNDLDSNDSSSSDSTLTASRSTDSKVTDSKVTDSKTSESTRSEPKPSEASTKVQDDPVLRGKLESQVEAGRLYVDAETRRALLRLAVDASVEVQVGRRRETWRVRDLIENPPVDTVKLVEQVVEAAKPVPASVEMSELLRERLGGGGSIEVMVRYRSGEVGVFSGRAFEVAELLQNPNIVGADLAPSGAGWLPDASKLAPGLQVEGGASSSDLAGLGELGPGVRIDAAAAGLANLVVYHGSLKGFEDAIRLGPKDVGSGFGGKGLYLSSGKDVALAEQYAQIASTSAKARKGQNPDGWNGAVPDAEAPLVMTGRIDPDKLAGLRVGKFIIDGKALRPDLERGILPSNWDLDPRLRAMIDGQFDIIVFTQRNTALQTTEPVVVVKESAGSIVRWDK